MSPFCLLTLRLTSAGSVRKSSRPDTGVILSISRDLLSRSLYCITLLRVCAYLFLSLFQYIIPMTHPGCPPSFLVFPMLSLEFLNKASALLKVLFLVLFALNEPVFVSIHSILVHLAAIGIQEPQFGLERFLASV